MRLRTLVSFLALGVAARAAYRYQQARRAPRAPGVRPEDLAADPRDPVQGFDEVIELQGAPLDVDALSNEDLQAAQDLAGLESEIDALAFEEVTIERRGRDAEASIELVSTDLLPIHDAGDLYGVHTPPAVDRALPDNDQAFAEGQNWIEALETSAIENGAEPELSLDDIIDDDDVLRAPHPSDLRDRPVADFGSGGRRGL